MEVRPKGRHGRCQDSPERLASHSAAVEECVDRVMVMDEDAALRVNRLALLNRLRGLFLHTADLSRLRS